MVLSTYFTPQGKLSTADSDPAVENYTEQQATDTWIGDTNSDLVLGKHSLALCEFESFHARTQLPDAPFGTISETHTSTRKFLALLLASIERNICLSFAIYNFTN